MSDINIIGISGKKGSGKDTVAAIFQWIAGKHDQEGEFEEYREWMKANPIETLAAPHCWNGDWRKKQFAGKLKQIVALLIGCKVEDLEDETFKNTSLEGDWNSYQIEVTLEYLHSDEEPMTYMDDNIFLNEQSAQEFLNNVYIGYVDDGVAYSGKVVRKQITPRKMLQLIGTEGLRDLIHPNVHVNALFADYKPYSVASKYLGDGEGFEFKDEYPKWLIPDTRFPNEAEAILKRDGIVVRVENPRVDHSDQHPSETSLDTWQFNYTIVNDGSMAELIEKVRVMMIAFKLI